MNPLQRLYDLTLQKNRERDLKNALFFRKALGNPDQLFSSIHITGTNGKGSVSLKIAKALEFSGFKTGLYTSPHLSSFRERIQINGEMISNDDFLRYLGSVFHLVDQLQISLTFFEVTTFVAFLYFAEAKVDYAVIEVGLGGRLDTTNMIKPILSVITSIGWDHTHILGDSLEQIAFEKAGIIKEGIPVVVGPKADFEVIHQVAKDRNAPLLKTPPSLHPFYDFENQQTAKKALLLLPVDQKAINKGLEYRPPCRFEKIPKQNVILDVAHNPSAFQKLTSALQFYYPGRPYRFFIAFSADKDIPGCLKEIIPFAKHIHIVTTSHARLGAVTRIEDHLKEMGFHAFSSSHDLEEELEKAMNEEDLLVVTGSFFIMGEMRKILGFKEEQDEILLQEQYTFNSSLSKKG